MNFGRIEILRMHCLSKVEISEIKLCQQLNNVHKQNIRMCVCVCVYIYIYIYIYIHIIRLAIKYKIINFKKCSYSLSSLSLLFYTFLASYL